MCGVAGMLSSGRVEASTIRRMVDSLRHRGPDDEGIWTDEEAGIALGHRRLAVIDLSKSGHQPMVSRDGRYLLTFNGEIYNHLALRTEVDSARERNWRGHSDTETFLEAIALWGLEETLRKSVGMFALGLWDRGDRKLFLARDRFGEKPLYYGWVGRDFVFASELKAIRTHLDFAGTIDRHALRIFAARGYVPAPRSIFEGIHKLEPGSILTLDGSGKASRAIPDVAQYWSYRTVVESGLESPFHDEHSARDELEAALSAAIKGQSVADVPIGVFLSGGIDSSTIVALYRKLASQNVRTYSIGFEETGFDEAPYAKEVSRHFGTEHTERYVTSQQAREVIPLLPTIYDEPFADPSQIPTYLMSKLAREEVTVALSGDGGDELLGGYTRYMTAANTWRKMQRAPFSVRRISGAVLGKIPASVWDGLAAIGPGRPQFPGTRLEQTFQRLQCIDSLPALYGSFRDEWSDASSPVIGGDADSKECGLDLEVTGGPDIIRMMYCDAVSYLPGDILCKVDRASMSRSLEVRIPFLDHRVAEVAARIPVGMKVRKESGKDVLKELLFSHVPRHLFDRPKAGFSVPVGAWIKGPLKSWAEDLLSRERLDREGFFCGATIQRRWQDHLAGRRDATWSLWPVLMFQAWKDESLE